MAHCDSDGWKLKRAGCRNGGDFLPAAFNIEHSAQPAGVSRVPAREFLGHVLQRLPQKPDPLQNDTLTATVTAYSSLAVFMEEFNSISLI